MKIHLRIPRYLCDAMRSDLVRPHPFAAERVGFARAVIGTIDEAKLVLLNSYWPVPDDQYIDDPDVGARINGTAIRDAMQDILSSNGSHGLFHIHMHPWKGRTGMSRTDFSEIPRLVQSFRNVAYGMPHGLLILTPDHAFSLGLIPGIDSLLQIEKITIVGYPTEILR